jgi:hypothetical protein
MRCSVRQVHGGARSRWVMVRGAEAAASVSTALEQHALEFGLLSQRLEQLRDGLIRRIATGGIGNRELGQHQRPRQVHGDTLGVELNPPRLGQQQTAGMIHQLKSQPFGRDRLISPPVQTFLGQHHLEHRQHTHDADRMQQAEHDRCQQADEDEPPVRPDQPQRTAEFRRAQTAARSLVLVISRDQLRVHACDLEISSQVTPGQAGLLSVGDKREAVGPRLTNHYHRYLPAAARWMSRSPPPAAARSGP